MVSLSIRARRELALLRAMDSLRVLAAVALPLHVLPWACVLYTFLTLQFGGLLMFLAWSTITLIFHWSLIRSAETLLEEPRRSVPLALGAATLLLLVMVGGQILISALYGVGLMLAILFTCGLFDLLTTGALVYAFWSSGHAAFGRIEPPSDRHVGFEVMLPVASQAEDEP